jgi:hypothetical protein
MLGVYYSKEKLNAPRLPASLLGGDKRRSPDWKAPRTSEDKENAEKRKQK